MLHAIKTIAKVQAISIAIGVILLTSPGIQKKNTKFIITRFFPASYYCLHFGPTHVSLRPNLKHFHWDGYGVTPVQINR